MACLGESNFRTGVCLFTAPATNGGVHVGERGVWGSKATPGWTYGVATTLKGDGVIVQGWSRY